MAGRRARIAFSESAAKQLEELTTIHALDRALVAISVDPKIGEARGRPAGRRRARHVRRTIPAGAGPTTG